MKKLISLALVLLMTLGCVGTAFANDNLEVYTSDDFDGGTAGAETLVPGSGWSLGSTANNDKVFYGYATDPENDNNIVFKFHRDNTGATGTQTRVKMRRYIAGSSAAFALAEDMVIKFRVYVEDATQNIQFNIRCNDGRTAEGTTLWSISFNASKLGQNYTKKWYDVRFDIDNLGTYGICNAWATANGNTVKLVDNSILPFKTADTSGNQFTADKIGIGQVDFESATQKTVNGSAYIDDFYIYTKKVDDFKVCLATLGTDKSGNETRTVITAPADNVTINGAFVNNLPTEFSEKANLLIAVYDGGILSGCSVAEMVGEGKYVLQNSLSTNATSEIKIFCWDKSTLVPFVNSVETYAD